MSPMAHGLQAGDVIAGWEGAYMVLEVTSATTAECRDLYWWERLRFWISDRWFTFTLDVRRVWRRILGDRTP